MARNIRKAVRRTRTTTPGKKPAVTGRALAMTRGKGKKKGLYKQEAGEIGKNRNTEPPKGASSRANMMKRKKA